MYPKSRAANSAINTEVDIFYGDNTIKYPAATTIKENKTFFNL
jgi:hypothetical protein